MDSSSVKDHRLSPPIVARYVRIQPLVVVKKPALRLELLGCDLNSEWVHGDSMVVAWWLHGSMGVAWG